MCILKNVKLKMNSSQGNKEIGSLCSQGRKLRSLDIWCGRWKHTRCRTRCKHHRITEQSFGHKWSGEEKNDKLWKRERSILASRVNKELCAWERTSWVNVNLAVIHEKGEGRSKESRYLWKVRSQIENVVNFQRRLVWSHIPSNGAHWQGLRRFICKLSRFVV